MKRFVFTLLALTCLALTPAERKLVQATQAELHQAQSEYTKAKDQATLADLRAADAQKTAADTNVKLADAQKQIKEYSDKADAIAAERDKMKPVYDRVNKGWGLGAIWYGIQDLSKHLLWVGLGVLGLVVVLYALSFAFPAIGAALAVVTSVFRVIAAFITRIIKSIEDHLRPKA
jgi:hypothetical protein